MLLFSGARVLPADGDEAQRVLHEMKGFPLRLILEGATHHDSRVRLATAQCMQAEPKYFFSPAVDGLVRIEMVECMVRQTYWSTALDLTAEAIGRLSRFQRSGFAGADHMLAAYLGMLSPHLATDLGGNLTDTLLVYRSEMLLCHVARHGAKLTGANLHRLLGLAADCLYPNIEASILANPWLSQASAVRVGAHLIKRIARRRRHQAENVARALPLLDRLGSGGSHTLGFPHACDFASVIIRLCRQNVIDASMRDEALECACRLIERCGPGQGTLNPAEFAQALQLPNPSVHLAILRVS